MPHITITAEAEAAIRGAASSNEFKGAKPNTDGSYTIYLQVSTLSMLTDQQQAGETHSDTIVRLFANAKGLQ